MRRLGLGLLAFVVLACLLGPCLSGVDPLKQDLGNVLAEPGLLHPLGTDHLGRSILARTLHGGLRSLGLALVCVAVAAMLGTALGLLAAWVGGVTEQLILRAADVFLAFPGMLLALLVSGLFGGGLVPLLVGLKLSLWPQFARMAHAGGRRVMASPHVEAALLLAVPGLDVALRDILPQIIRPVLAVAALATGSAILSIASLGFLGLGLQPPVPEWGASLNEATPYFTDAPLAALAPAMMIFLSVLGLSLIGEGKEP